MLQLKSFSIFSIRLKWFAGKPRRSSMIMIGEKMVSHGQQSTPEPGGPRCSHSNDLLPLPITGYSIHHSGSLLLTQLILFSLQLKPLFPLPTLYYVLAVVMASPRPVAKKTAISRKRSAQACLSCRSRKVRCDVISHGLPCTNCELDDKSCHVVGRASNV